MAHPGNGQAGVACAAALNTAAEKAPIAQVGLATLAQCWVTSCTAWARWRPAARAPGYGELAASCLEGNGQCHPSSPGALHWCKGVLIVH